MSKKGTLIGVGVGPGDESLMSAAACSAIEGATTIAYIHAVNRDSMARTIAAKAIQKGAREIAIGVDMAAGEAERRAAYDNAMPEIETVLNAGENVVFLCEGDALFYGSFNHVLGRLGDDFSRRVVPGVNSLSAAAAATKTQLASDDDVFTVIPATLKPAALSTALATPGPKAIIKLGRNLEIVKTALEKSARLEGALLVSHAGSSDETVQALGNVETAPYFSLVLVPPSEPMRESVPDSAAVVVLNATGLEAGRALAATLPGAHLKVSGKHFDNVTTALQGLFKDGTPIVAVMASGIVIRALAGLLADKTNEPAVVSVSADGAHAVPLLGGHGGGANRLARACASALGGVAAVTTASDNTLGFALDDPPAGWRVANADAAKAVTAKLLAPERVGLAVESGDASWLKKANTTFDESMVPPTVRVTHHVADVATLTLHPPTLALGVGCERGTDPSELRQLATETLASAGLAEQAVACVVSLDVKADEAAVLALADDLGVAARFFNATELEAETPRLANPSDTVFAEVGCHGVAEGAALAGVGAGGSLIVEKQKSARATCAVALAPKNTGINPETVGKGAGKLYIVGTGPGSHVWRTAELSAVLSQVTDVVGYSLYLDLVEDLIHGKTRHTSQLSEEEARVRMALELAAEGKSVALVSSGDPGIYAMAALAFELLDREDRTEWNRVGVQVCPGISAFQAASARMGAPMGHDFCLISLSDLLTPWEVIEQRLKAAAVGGFQVAFYNPVSKRRQKQIVRARDILLEHRDPNTPVALAKNLGRDGEAIEVIALQDLGPERVDMLTLVIVGGPDTRTMRRGVNQWVYTPRGYGGKMDNPAKSDGDKL